MAMIKCWHFRNPRRNIFGKSHPIGYAHDMAVFAHIKMYNVVINLAAKRINNTHEARTACFRNAIVEDDSSFFTWWKLEEKY